MTTFSKRAAISRIGAGVIEICCGKARHIWRETSRSDVGVDGQIEIVRAERATGRFIAVQIKTGTSHVSKDRKIFRVNTDKRHFSYWSSLAMPVIAVVVDPRDLIACWIDLTAHCTPERVKHGPYTAPIARTPSSTLTPETMTSDIVALALSYSRASAIALPKPITPAMQPELIPTAKSPTATTKYVAQRLAWNKMCEDFTSSANIRVVASAGHRLSWYFTSVPPEFVTTLDTTLRRMTDADLSRAISAAQFVFNNGGEHVAELIADLLARVPRARSRIRSLVKTEMLPANDRECAVQILEMWAAEPLHGLWRHVPNDR